MTIGATEYTFLSKLLKDRSGLSLTEDKIYLLESRLLPVTRKHNIADIPALITLLKEDSNSDLCTEVIEAMTTNETSFFRDIKPFDYLRDTIFPEVIPHIKSDSLNVWSAACSSGQEAYSIAMTSLENAATLNNKKVSITATDLDHAILAKAEKGLYTQFEVQRGLPITLLVKYFEQQEDHWQLKEEVKNIVSFKHLNLLDDYTPLGKFDIIFCRNVLIYFDDATKTNVLEKMADTMNPHGVLFLGSAETAHYLTDRFSPFKDIKGAYTLASS